MIDMDNILLSIIIPTKNRQQYAIESIRQILSHKSDKIQLIVQDNSDNDNLRGELSSLLRDTRLKYNYIQETLSFVDNFSAAISLADGYYICAIGDDDGINSEIIEFVEWAYQNQIDAITPGLQAVYLWPNSNVLSNDDLGTLNIYNIKENFRYCDSQKEVIRFLKNGCVNYLDYGLVKLYHGVVKRSLFDIILRKTNKYIGGLSPDIYSSISLSLLCENVILIDYPLTISGICSTSGSADSASGKHTGRLEDAPHFRGHTNYTWSNKVPRFYSVETIWADSALAAVSDINTEYIRHFDYSVFVAYVIRRYKLFSKEIFDTFFNVYKSENKLNVKMILFFGYMKGPFKTKAKKILKRFSVKKRACKIQPVEDISSAADELNEYLAVNNLSIKKIIWKLKMNI